MEKNKKLGKKIAFAVAVAAACAGLLFGPSLIAGETAAQAQEAETPVFSVRMQQAVSQTLYARLDVNGDVVSTQQVDVFPEVGGRIASVRATLGDFVNQGDIIAEVDPSRPGMVFMNSNVYAPISGFVSRTPLSVGMTISTASSITSIAANGDLEINARIPEREISGLAPGLRASVTLPAHPGQTFGATVNRVSPVVDAASRTKLINLRFDQRDPRLSPGMFARVQITTRTYNNVLSVPSQAVVSGPGGAQAVFVVGVDQDGAPAAQRREVQTGITLQGFTEIRSGVEAGENVVTQGQQLLAGGESLRIIGAAPQSQIAGGVQ